MQTNTSQRLIRWAAFIEAACSVLWTTFWISVSLYKFSFLICFLSGVLSFGWWRVFRKEKWRTSLKARILLIVGILLTPLIAAYQYLCVIIFWTDFGRYLLYIKHFDEQLVGNLFMTCYAGGLVCVAVQALIALGILVLMAFTLILKKSLAGGRIIACFTGVLGFIFLAFGLLDAFINGSFYLTLCLLVGGFVFVAAGIGLNLEVVNKGR